MKISTKRKTRKRRNRITHSYHSLTLIIKAGLSDDQTGLFSDMFEGALSFSAKKEKPAWQFLWTFDFRPDEAELVAHFAILAQELKLDPSAFSFAIEYLDEKRDWLAESYQALPPFFVGSFFIYGSHYDGAKPNDKIPLLIEAATAFGSGEHGTTSRCMLAIEHVKESGFKPRNILDMGCGSGILAIAAAKLWPEVPVFAADNDPECVLVTNRHIVANDVENIHSYKSEGYEAQSPVWKDAPYDFIIANILAGPLIEMAAEQSGALAQDGYLILSGTLQEQGERVTSAYTAHGLKLIAQFPGDEWITLLMQK